ncbi:MAG: helix-turn-helix domain-containing protein [Candidatus Scalindua sp.]
MINIDNDKLILTGPKGTIPLNVDDEITRKFSMLFEGECEGLGASAASIKFGFTRQRYYQLLQKFQNEGAEALKRKKTGPQTNYRRTDEVVRQIIRHRFLDPAASPAVIAQKLDQCGYSVSVRSVERVISQFGLQKKTAHLPSRKRTSKN